MFERGGWLRKGSAVYTLHKAMIAASRSGSEVDAALAALNKRRIQWLSFHAANDAEVWGAAAYYDPRTQTPPASGTRSYGNSKNTVNAMLKNIKANASHQDGVDLASMRVLEEEELRRLKSGVLNDAGFDVSYQE